ncbi:hypothetical protein L7F22_059588 [Adiantum nelumboides]|nr:hypothetical protein [Adiantum nelumboides]
MVTTLVLRLQECEHEFVFLGISLKPIASLLRGFSAPIQLVVTPELNKEEMFLFTNDSDDFSRWDVGQFLGKMLLIDLIKGNLQDGDMVMASYINAIRQILLDAILDKEFIALLITLPTVEEVIDAMEDVDPDVVWRVHQGLLKKIAKELKQEFLTIVFSSRNQNDDVLNKLGTKGKGMRASKNAVLSYLAALGEEEMDMLLYEYEHASNLSKKLAALTAIFEYAQPTTRQRV